ncbi:DUF523 and DUF1722 domain-containing protein [Pseudomonas aeruginosa]|uniref:DUF523 and DUF1722 domain-containing protein n=2 Tax=Pseudomonas aeruginosa TaxID=287 RepID=UPI0005A80735|nr:DUF523 and DUF1722 domain-containing protein [Pseudomonas aeruginosa]KSS19712.1 hypothetical protein APB60_07250 [Pseudomonas aeruginosa]MBG5303828.1 DUF523 and DUF1722 domain-containing protein [Pseudomonas aeruginosa]MDA3279507.1 DUF523 and DUF1722 domain-containing protein [Pseudomonas aeruginosa]MDI3650586.1 DUF523 and DUF1722 domain-containing protein [Pseudomonas aeruginosa]MDI3798691.1 DUF523 and DUF1722 domain-containing protein [Pseudomonas aeruginosa]
MHESHPSLTPRLGISACLLGEPVRFNGGHKRSALCEELARHVEFVSFCPEQAIGLGTPRPAIRLEGTPEAAEARSRDGLAVGGALAEYGRRVAQRTDTLDGFIFMQRSPSCGLQRVKVYPEGGGAPRAEGRGRFAAALCEALPELPVEEEGRLHDPVLRENFLTRVFAHAHWQALCQRGLSHSAIVAFHSRYKYQLLAHSPEHYRSLGRLLGEAGHYQPEALGTRYFGELMQGLRRCATRGSHGNVLLHLSGYLKRDLTTEDRRELRELIEQYRHGSVPLVVPLTLLKHHFRRHPHAYIAQQAYLQPHPTELGLRNAL